MAGNGGATGYESTNETVADVHSMLLTGHTEDASPIEWTGTAFTPAAGEGGAAGTPFWVNTEDFEDNPSALRFLLQKGLTDVGGNPFEGISAFEVDELIGEVKDRYTLYNELIENYDPETEWTSYVTEALGQTDTVVPELDVDSLVSTIVNMAISRAASLAADAVNQAAEDKRTQLDSTQVKQLATAVSALPTIGTAAETQANLNITNVAATAFALAQTESDGDYTKAEADSETALTSIGASVPTITDLLQTAADAKAKALAPIQTALANTDGAANMSNVTDASALAVTAAGDVLTDARTDAKLSASTILADLDPNTEALIARMYTLAVGNTTGILTNAINAAASAIDTAIVDDVVAGFKSGIENGHFRNINRMAGGMADINSVNSSAYIFAFAGLESDYLKEEAKFRSDLSRDLYVQALNGYLQTFTTNQAQYIAGYFQQLDKSLDVYRLELPLQTQMFSVLLPQYVQTYLTGYGEYLKTYLTLSAEHGEKSNRLSTTQATMIAQFQDARKQMALSLAQMHMGSITGLTDLEAQTYAQGIAEELKTFDSIMRSRLAASSGLVSEELNNTVRTRIQESVSKAGFTTGAIAQQDKLKTNQLMENRASASLLSTMATQSIIANSEENDRNIGYDVSSAGWDMSLFQQVGNLISASTGSVIPTAGQPSKTQSALAGAGAGAGLGIQIGSSGGAPGMAIGAGIGGVVGGVGGLLYSM